MRPPRECPRRKLGRPFGLIPFHWASMARTSSRKEEKEGT
jgi:hypothetical protein